jgi:hypothetical protein
MPRAKRFLPALFTTTDGRSSLKTLQTTSSHPRIYARIAGTFLYSLANDSDELHRSEDRCTKNGYLHSKYLINIIIDLCQNNLVLRSTTSPPSTYLCIRNRSSACLARTPATCIGVATVVRERSHTFKISSSRPTITARMIWR